ncbi:MAG: hypothetical protein AB7T59_06750 [Hyphomonadaceae bacterium]
MMRSCLALFYGLAILCYPASPQAQERACTDVEYARDGMGVRARDEDGNWRYVTSSEIESISVARFARGAHAVENGRRGGRIPGYVTVNRLSAERLSQLLGPCGETYAMLLGPSLDLPELEQSDGQRPRLAHGQMMAFYLTAAPLRYYATEGTDLVVFTRSIYAVHDYEACGLAPPSEEADLCAPEQRREFTGVVRRIADSLADLGVTEVQRSTYRFVDGKLIADIRVRTASGRQELHFAED